MSGLFRSRLAVDLEAFLTFKRSLGYSYRRNEYVLRSFDRYVAAHASRHGSLALDRLVDGWLCRIEGRRSVTIAADLITIRQFLLFRRRSDPQSFVPSRTLHHRSMESHFVPYVFSRAEILAVLRHAQALPGPPLHALSVRVLILMLYCTGLRPGEAIRLRLADVDLDGRSFLVRQSKGKTRLVPFRADLGRELRRYRAKRPAGSVGDTFLVQPDGRPYTSMVAWTTLRGIFVRAGLKAPHGRAGPRPYDFRHAFAVHRLTSWYRAGANLHARLPWLSTYMWHDNLLGTETYLTATPELLRLASRRFEDHVRKAGPKR